MAIINIARVIDWQRIPIDAQDVVTKARIVLLGQPTSERRELLTAYTVHPPASYTPTPYYPVPVVVEHEDALHTTYGTERSLELRENIDPFLPPTSSVIPDPNDPQDDWVNKNNARDGDLTTYASYSPNTPSGWLTYTFNPAAPELTRRVIGFRLAYTYTADPDHTGPEPRLTAQFFVTELNLLGLGSTVGGTWDFPPAGELADYYVFLPPAYTSQVPTLPAETQYTLRLMPWSDGVTNLRAYAFYPLVIDTNLVENIAKAQIRLPAASPLRVTVKGRVPPAAEHTIVGWPGGDYTGPVARQSYTPDGNTVIDFEQAGAPPGLPMEAVEAERVRLGRTQDLIRTATYANLIRARR